MIRIRNLKIRKDLSEEEVMQIAIKKYKIHPGDILHWSISKKSIDARKKEDVHYVYSLDFALKDETKYPHLERIKEASLPKIQVKNASKKQPVIIGCGPSGIFAALTLMQHGISPIVIEQGDAIEERKLVVDRFRKEGKLNPLSNVQFGEGGAGTFSDGKLTSGIHSPYCHKVLQEFVNYGAPASILYLTKPHIGTDHLIHVIQNMRKAIQKEGGTFLFQTKAIDFCVENGKIHSVICQNKDGIQEIKTSFVILAIGHSARDTFKKLHEKGISMEKKNFSVGVRIEHLQEQINKAQYGTQTKLNLPPAEYKLAYHSPSGRSCYTFCMCPGGEVIASSSEKNTIVTNGMSYYLRDGKNANSALLVNVTPNDFPDPSPLAGMDFQKKLEEKAFVFGGSNYYAPVQRVEDFFLNRKSEKIGKIIPSYLPGYTFANLQEILPHFVTKTLQEGISYFDTKLKGFADPDSILTGVETRSSSPVKILRNDHFVSNILGIYPCGEGAGYAGGIMSAAVDGIKCAMAILES